jgi:hypothetical protein
MMGKDKSKWCATFLRKIRKEFYSMQSKAWYDHLLGTVDPEFCRMSERRRMAVEDADLDAEARNGLSAFLSNFTHFNLPEGAELGVDGQFRGMGGNVYLTIRWPGQEAIPVSKIEHDPKCVESVWEKEVLTWVSSQFCLFWHDGYSQCTILLGDATGMEREIRRMDHGVGFLSSIDEMPAAMKREYLATDFSPKVEDADGNPRIVFHIFSPFGGIFRRVACSEVPEEEEPLFPYDCGICY